MDCKTNSNTMFRIIECESRVKEEECELYIYTTYKIAGLTNRVLSETNSPSTYLYYNVSRVEEY